MQPEAATLRLAVLPRAGLLVDALLVFAGAGFIALAAQVAIHLGFTPVPITGQTFAVCLVGAAYGPGLGAASAVLYLVVGLAGAPVYADHAHGWAEFSGATGGYIVGFVVAAALTGFLAERRWDRRFSTAVTAMLSGNVVIYAFGLPWLHHSLGVSWSKALEYGLYPFVAGDVVKVYVAALALPGAWRLVRRVKGSAGGERRTGP
jgi:biotin transport system substrate-specific component